MRKHNTKFARRVQRTPDPVTGKPDRSNMPQSMAHALVNDKQNQMFANRTLSALLFRAGAVRVQEVL